MVCIKTRSNGYRIKKEDGSLFPRIYKTLKLCQERVDQLKRHSKKK